MRTAKRMDVSLVHPRRFHLDRKPFRNLGSGLLNNRWHYRFCFSPTSISKRQQATDGRSFSPPQASLLAKCEVKNCPHHSLDLCPNQDPAALIWQSALRPESLPASVSAAEW